MNSSIDLNAAESSFICSLPLSLLRIIELAVLKRRYASLVWTRPEQDRWLVAGDRGVAGPVRFGEVLQRLVQGEAPLAFLHEDESNQEPEPWQFFDYRPCSVDRATRWAWIIAFWIAVIFLGWIATSTLEPGSLEPVLQWVYFVAVVGAIIWLSLPASIKTKLRQKHS